jgi:hypothetical protein
MAKRKKNGLNANDLTIAQAVAGEKYDPQISQIKGLYGQAGKQLASDITAAKAGAKSAVVYSKSARPTVKSDYKDATKTVNQDAADTLAAFGTIGQAADIFRAAAAREHNDYKSRIATDKVGALQELTDRATSAQAGRAFAVNKARQDYKDTTGTLGQQLVALRGAKGNSMAAQLGTLMEQRADRAVKVKTAKISAGAGDNKVITSGAFQGMTNAEVRALTPKAKQQKVDAFNATQGKGKTGNRRTVKEQTGLNSGYSSATSWAARLRAQLAKPPKQGGQGLDPNSKASRHAVAQILLQGRLPSKQGQGIPKQDQLPLTLALDTVYDGHISRNNAQRLHDLGYKVDDLNNAATATQYERKHPRKPKRPQAPNVFNTNPFTGAPLGP